MKIFFLRRKRRAEETNEKILWEKEILIHREKRKMQKEKTFFLPTLLVLFKQWNL